MDLTIKGWLDEAKRCIAALDAELIAVCNFAPNGRDRSWLVAHGERKVAGESLSRANQMMEKRRKGMPLAYVLGYREFYGRKFMVNRHVLIPRPETETLVDLIKELELPRLPQFLEIGTGSGCIAITLALEFPQAYVMATDISVTALDMAYENDVLHEGRVEFMQSNLLRDLVIDPHAAEFDVLVANLPYVNPEWNWLDRRTLDFEPKTALYAKGEGGISMYRRLFREIMMKRKVDGILKVKYIVIEADPCQHEALRKCAEEFGLLVVRTRGFGLVLV